MRHLTIDGGDGETLSVDLPGMDVGNFKYIMNNQEKLKEGLINRYLDGEKVRYRDRNRESVKKQ